VSILKKEMHLNAYCHHWLCSGIACRSYSQSRTDERLPRHAGVAGRDLHADAGPLARGCLNACLAKGMAKAEKRGILPLEIIGATPKKRVGKATSKGQERDTNAWYNERYSDYSGNRSNKFLVEALQNREGLSMARIVTYGLVGIMALWLTSASNQIERNIGSVEVGFPFVNVADNTANPTGRGSISSLDDFWNLQGFVGNVVVYGVIVLTIWRVMQSSYAGRMQPSLRYLLPCSGIAGMCFVGASMGYNPFPSYQYRPPTPTVVPAHVNALIRRWSGTDTVTGQPIALHFAIYDVTLSTPDGDFKGTYDWITHETIVIRLGHYVFLDGATESLSCPNLPTAFNIACQQQRVSGYPAPLVSPPVLQVPVGSYPAPLPAPVNTNSLYQGIEGAYGIVVSHTGLTLIAPTGEVQSFTETR
jgi:hypothetical protein